MIELKNGMYVPGELITSEEICNKIRATAANQYKHLGLFKNKPSIPILRYDGLTWEWCMTTTILYKTPITLEDLDIYPESKSLTAYDFATKSQECNNMLLQLLEERDKLKAEVEQLKSVIAEKNRDIHVNGDLHVNGSLCIHSEDRRSHVHSQDQDIDYFSSWV